MEDLKVLLIEDDPDDHVIIKQLLSEIPSARFLLDWVTDYDTALKALGDNTYDICLLDYRLGAHDGLELLTEAKKGGLASPILFLTGQGRYEVDVQAMNLGAADYLVKDQLTAALLERAIRYAIERETSKKALQKANEELEMRVREKTADLAEVNRELQRESEKIKLFAYSVSHDLKNPVIGLHGLSRRLLKRYGDVLDEKGRTYLRHIMQSAQQIAVLTEGINAFISSKETPINAEDVDLNQALDAIRREFSEHFTSRNIRWSHPDHLPVIRADQLSLMRVIRNLVDNALKYGGDELGEIRIGFSETKSFWIVSVSDDGIGIGTENPDTLFGPFSRIGSPPHTEGLGLGLAIVQEIAHQHKGEVWAEPGPSGGATFSISIFKGNV